MHVVKLSAYTFSFPSRYVLQAFAPMPTFGVKSSTALEACRVNAKKEKIKRNRENMRKFQTGGRRGTSRRKTLKKIQSSTARAEEAEFIAKCFIASPPPDAEE